MSPILDRTIHLPTGLSIYRLSTIYLPTPLHWLNRCSYSFLRIFPGFVPGRFGPLQSLDQHAKSSRASTDEGEK